MPEAKLNDVMISRLAREIARDILPLDEILKTYKLSTGDFDQIAEMPYFQQRLNEETALWSASDPVSIAKRIEAKAATMIEDCLVEVYRLIHDPEQPMNAKIEGLKWAARMAGLGENAQKTGEAGGVKITINVGGKALEFDKERALPQRVTDVVDLTPERA